MAAAVGGETVLYPGSYVDVAPSFVWPEVTYVDVDRRAEQFFGDRDGVDELLREHGVDPDRHSIRFVRADYTDGLDMPDSSVDVLVSLYAGLISEHCTRHLRIGGHLFVNPSHGDVAMASLDPRYRLWGVVVSRAGDYSVRRDDLGEYLVPKRDADITVEALRETGRGIAYTKSPFAYLFERVT